jgi:hypothetical protein
MALTTDIGVAAKGATAALSSARAETAGNEKATAQDAAASVDVMLGALMMVRARV